MKSRYGIVGVLGGMNMPRSWVILKSFLTMNFAAGAPRQRITSGLMISICFSSHGVQVSISWVDGGRFLVLPFSVMQARHLRMLQIKTC